MFYVCHPVHDAPKQLLIFRCSRMSGPQGHQSPQRGWRVRWRELLLREVELSTTATVTRTVVVLTPTASGRSDTHSCPCPSGCTTERQGGDVHMQDWERRKRKCVKCVQKAGNRRSPVHFLH